MDEWIRKMWYIYTMEYYSATKKNEQKRKNKKQKRKKNCSNMDGTRNFHTKSKREKQTPYDITYMWSLKYDTNDQLTIQKR